MNLNLLSLDIVLRCSLQKYIVQNPFKKKKYSLYPMLSTDIFWLTTFTSSGVPASIQQVTQVDIGKVGSRLIEYAIMAIVKKCIVDEGSSLCPEYGGKNGTPDPVVAEQSS